MNSEDFEFDSLMDEDGLLDWCVCNVCVDMVSEEENKCCGKRVCVILYEMFWNVVLDREVFNIVIRVWCDIRVEVVEFEMNSYCKVVYR